MNEIMTVDGIDISRDRDTGEYYCGYVGNLSAPAELRTTNPIHLGFGYRPERRGNLAWDIAFGYVSGFPIRAILWFVLTRSLPPESIRKRIQAWELRTGKHDPGIRLIHDGGHVTISELREATA